MSRTLKISLSLVVVFAAALTFLLVLDRPRSPDEVATEQATADPASIAVRENSHRLNSVPDGRVTFVEFLDFECEACRSVYPAIEQLREDYGDRVTFVVRYFPIASHFNAERAARAVEAAAQQGRFEAMYQRMYETQAQWGEQQTPQDDLFRSFAVDQGLDMSAFDAAYTDPATLERIQTDVADGMALGVQGTPTFFLNGTKIEPTTYGDLADALDVALG
ncbi:thioredoxin [Rhodococcus sp. PAMC28707]|uniref:DsbA family protein n=1 Tax=unclassified Rhodococcus (in: high G+C Gram-positive bacteria) TaxID=192944 RepID=UPI00109DF584|nr:MULTISPECIES: thioredoxin domain-containing protein [unclassified Rhodococcus (in: high G+C Gram-positive bacteria)]QCB51311.1 thioredoxin [Rhodococcus sp. PAMC28705]QCB60521.1 thioredoxin [Rhodococcus sp. PAMC28707]